MSSWKTLMHKNAIKIVWGVKSVVLLTKIQALFGEKNLGAFFGAFWLIWGASWFKHFSHPATRFRLNSTITIRLSSGCWVLKLLILTWFGILKKSWKTCFRTFVDRWKELKDFSVKLFIKIWRCSTVLILGKKFFPFFIVKDV